MTEEQKQLNTENNEEVKQDVIDNTPGLQESGRNADGTFKKGVSGNPSGKKPGQISILGRIKKVFEENLTLDDLNINDLSASVSAFIDANQNELVEYADYYIG